jgi:hypothetical protein
LHNEFAIIVKHELSKQIKEVDVSGNSIIIKYQIENELYKYLDGSKCILSFTWNDVMNKFAYWACRNFELFGIQPHDFDSQNP